MSSPDWMSGSLGRVGEVAAGALVLVSSSSFSFASSLWVEVVGVTRWDRGKTKWKISAFSLVSS